MTAAEYRRRAELCKQAARRCACVAMGAIWLRHFDNLLVMALRAERGWK
jgi:hypothetical protein